MENKINESFDFVLRHYRRNAFIAYRQFIKPVIWWKRRGAAAVLTGCILAASAAFVYVELHKLESSTKIVDVITEKSSEIPETTVEVKRIDFADVPVDSVVRKIENVYGVKVEGITETDTMRLTLNYNGTVQDLIDAINLTLGTNLYLSK